MTIAEEVRITIEGQEYYRGNKSPAWFAVNGGLAESIGIAAGRRTERG